MHLNFPLNGVRHSPYPRHNQPLLGQMMMLRMMMQIMQQMLHTMTAQGGQYQFARPCFGHGGQAQGSFVPGAGVGRGYNPLGGFLGGHCGGAQVFRAPSQASPVQSFRAHQSSSMAAPTAGHWQSSGAQGNLGGRLPGPLQRYAGAFEHYGKKYGVDPKFLAAISMLETGRGTSKAFRHKNNAMGVSNRSGPIAFASVEQSIERMARVLAKKNGPYAGKRTIGQIAGVYCPVGAGNDVNGTNHHWPRMVSKFYTQLGGNPSVAVKA